MVWVGMFGGLKRVFLWQEIEEDNDLELNWLHSVVIMSN